MATVQSYYCSSSFARQINAGKVKIRVLHSAHADRPALGLDGGYPANDEVAYRSRVRLRQRDH